MPVPPHLRRTVIENASIEQRLKTVLLSAYDGNVESLGTLCGMYEDAALGLEDALLLLAISHKNLDLSTMPHPGDIPDLGKPSEKCLHVFRRAVLALHLINIGSANRALTGDTSFRFWTRVWEWVGLLHQYRHHQHIDVDEEAVARDVLIFLARVDLDSPELGSDGVILELFGWAWMSSFETPCELISRGVAGFLLWQRPALADGSLNSVIRGAGGKQENLAYLIVQQLLDGHVRLGGPSDFKFLSLFGVLSLLMDLPPHFRDALLEAGLVRGLVRLLCDPWFLQPEPGCSEIRHGFLTVLLKNLQGVCRRQLRCSLSHGILRALSLEQERPDVVAWVAELSVATVYYGVVKQLEVEVPKLGASPVSRGWAPLMHLTAKRIELKHMFDSKPLLAHRIEISCSALKQVPWCAVPAKPSPTARAIAKPPIGGHAIGENAAIYILFGKASVCETELSTREQAFMRAILQQDFPLEVAEATATVFDYTTCPPTVSFAASPADLTAYECVLSLNFPYLHCRAAASEGRLRLRPISMVDAGKLVSQMFLMPIL
ncbi:hypothetical protein C8J57DRAFT_1525709 [Mycena rebaudengoi]|nr:hypothetical protein C8J57DRAFT_1525709 [Mycena rebaudengoi]